MYVFHCEGIRDLEEAEEGLLSNILDFFPNDISYSFT